MATVAELEQTSWKHVRNESEFMFKGVKDAWMRRQLEQEVGGWGRQEEVYNEPEQEISESESEVNAESEEGDDDDSADSADNEEDK